MKCSRSRSLPASPHTREFVTRHASVMNTVLRLCWECKVPHGTTVTSCMTLVAHITDQAFNTIVDFTTSKLLTQKLQILAITCERTYNCRTFLVTVCVDWERFKPALLNTMKGHAERPSLIWLRWFRRHFYSDVAVADLIFSQLALVFQLTNLKVVTCHTEKNQLNVL